MDAYHFDQIDPYQDCKEPNPPGCFDCGHRKSDHVDGLDMCLFIKNPNAAAVDDRFCSCSTFQEPEA